MKLWALTTARLKYVAMPWSSTGGIVTLTEPAAAFCSLRSLAPVPRTGVTVYVNFLPRSAVLSPPSHQLNFWIGALSLPLGFDAFGQRDEVDLVEQELRLAVLAVAGVALDREADKSGWFSPSGQSKVKRTHPGLAYAFTVALEAIEVLPPGSNIEPRKGLSAGRETGLDHTIPQKEYRRQCAMSGCHTRVKNRVHSASPDSVAPGPPEH